MDGNGSRSHLGNQTLPAVLLSAADLFIKRNWNLASARIGRGVRVTAARSGDWMPGAAVPDAQELRALRAAPSPSRSADWAHNRRLPPSHCYLVRKGMNPAGARLSEWFVYVTAPASISWPRRSPVWKGKQTPYRVLIAATNGAPTTSVLSQHFVVSGLERWQKQLGLDH
jgi:hypothetical protein